MNFAPSVSQGSLRRLLGLFVLACALVTPLAHADEYSDVNQLLRSGKYSEALSKADQYLASKPRDPQMRFLKGVVQTEAGKPVDAIATFVKLTEDYPELPEPFNNLAVLYASQGQYDKARAALEMAVRTNPSYATAQENLGDIYAKMASQAYAKALQLDSNNASVRPKLALIREVFSAPSAKPPRQATLAPGPSATTASAAAKTVSTSVVGNPPSAQAPVASTPARNVSPAGSAASGAATTSSGNLATGQKQ